MPLACLSTKAISKAKNSVAIRNIAIVGHKFKNVLRKLWRKLRYAEAAAEQQFTKGS